MHLRLKLYIACLLILGGCSSTTAPSRHVYGWQEWQNKTTKELARGFFVSSEDLSPLFKTGAQKAPPLVNKNQPEDMWAYGIELDGEGEHFSQEKIQMFRLDGHELVHVDSGTVVIDQDSRTVTISLKILYLDHPQDFIGNGIYAIR